MTQLVVWLGVCLALSVALRARPMVAVCLAVLLWVGVPAIAGHLLTGMASGAFAFHPATWLLMMTLLVQLARDATPLVSALVRHIFIFLIVLLFAAAAFITSRYTGSHGTRLLIDQIIGPGVLTWLVIAYGEGQLSKLRLLRGTILFGAAAEAVLSIVQFGTKNILFYGDSYTQLTWFNPDTFQRWMGTTDSPLVLSLLVCVAGGLSLGLRRWWLRSLLLILFLATTLIVQSRTGTAVLIAILLLTIVRAKMALWARALSIAGTGVAGWYIVSSGLASGLTGRLTNDSGSADARLRALRFIASNVSNYLITGGGLTSSYAIGRNGGLQTSIESSYLMFVIDTGLLLATLYFGLQVVLLFRYARLNALPGAALGASAGVLLQHTFSSVAGTNLCGVIIWSAIAIVICGSTLPVLQPAGELEAIDVDQRDQSLTISAAPAARRAATSSGR